MNLSPTTWLSILAIIISAAGLISKFRVDWATASKTEVDSAASLAKQAIDLLNTEREVSKRRSDENHVRLVELESARDHLNQLIAEQSVDIDRLKRQVKDCLVEKDQALQNLISSTTTIEERKRKIVDLEKRIQELENHVGDLR